VSTADDVVANPAQDEAVVYEVTSSGVAVLTLNRPDRLTRGAVTLPPRSTQD
jgi:hypothetical protein